jgi:hypothetical protein
MTPRIDLHQREGRARDQYFLPIAETINHLSSCARGAGLEQNGLQDYEKPSRQ